MLSNVGLLKEFWAEAVHSTYYLLSRSPSISINCKTPKGIWSTSLLIMQI